MISIPNWICQTSYWLVHILALVYVVSLEMELWRESNSFEGLSDKEEKWPSENLTLTEETPAYFSQQSMDNASLVDLAPDEEFGQPSPLRWINSRLFCRDTLKKGPETENFRTHGRYTVLHRHVEADRTYRCDESVTYTTQATYPYLGKILELLPRWSGPLSVAIYAPGMLLNSFYIMLLYLAI
jgi:hypothetical protein